RLDVGTAGDVDGEAVAGEELGDPLVRDPAAVAQAGEADLQPRRARVADAVDRPAQAQPAGRLEQEAVQLGAALAVAPVADPDQVGLGLEPPERVEDAGVGGLVPGPGPLR